MSYLQRLTEQRPDRAIEAALRNTISDAVSKWKLAYEGSWVKGGIGISNIRSKHAAVTNQATGLQGTGTAGSAVWGITALTQSTWLTWLNLAIDDRLYLVITGFFNKTQPSAIAQIKFSANGEEMPVLDVEELDTYDMAHAYLVKPFAVSPGNNLTVEVLPHTSKAAKDVTGVVEHMGLLGYAVGKRAVLIQK